MRWFVQPESIVRRIWGDGDVVLLVFAGAAAEFALNRAVDWLFFTGVLPADPVGRFFSTVAYAQKIVFADSMQAERTLAHISRIHAGVEQQRGARIPAWAYRDVLYMLIDYSERAFATLHRPLTPAEQEELYAVFRRVGIGLHISELPQSYAEWRLDRQRHLQQDLAFSPHTAALYTAYRHSLNGWRFALLRQIQAVLAPPRVRQLLNLPNRAWLRPLLALYPRLNRLGIHPLARRILIPHAHLPAVERLYTRPSIEAQIEA